jgi:hypothetical protein
MTHENGTSGGVGSTGGSAWLRVNYGINRSKRKDIEHANGKMRIKGAWDDNATHMKIRRIIARRHPGWAVTGWCLASPNVADQPRPASGE